MLPCSDGGIMCYFPFWSVYKCSSKYLHIIKSQLNSPQITRSRFRWRTGGGAAMSWKPPWYFYSSTFNFYLGGSIDCNFQPPVTVTGETAYKIVLSLLQLDRIFSTCVSAGARRNCAAIVAIDIYSGHIMQWRIVVENCSSRKHSTEVNIVTITIIEDK